MAETGNRRHIAITLIGNLFSPLAAIVTAPILTHSLSVSDRGIVAGATAPVLFALVIGTVGLPESATHFIASRPGAFRSIFWKSTTVILLTGAGVAGIIWVLAPTLSGDNPELTRLVRLCSLVLIPGLVTGLLRGTAAGLNRWTLIAVEKLLSGASRLILIAGLAIFDNLTVDNAAYVMAASSVYGIAAYAFGGLRKFDSSSQDDQISYGGLVSFGLRIWMGTTAGVILSRIDQVLLPSLAGVEELAYYAVAISISELAGVLIFAIRDVAFRAESKVADIARTVKMARFALLGSGTIVLPLIIAGPWWVPFVFGAPYSASVLPMSIMLLSVFLNAPGSIAGSALSGRGFPQLRSYAVMAAAILNVALVFILAPAHGALGASVATLVAASLASSMCVTILARKTQTRRRDYYLPHRSDFAQIYCLLGDLTAKVKERF